MNNTSTRSPATSSRRRAGATNRLSLFYQDLASPICSSSSRHHSRLPTSSTTSAAADPPPPPIFTLDDRVTSGDLSPEHASPSSWTPPVRSFSRSRSLSSPTKAASFRARLEEASGSGTFDKGMAQESPVEGVVQTGPSIVQSPFDRGLKRVELRRDDSLNGGPDEEEWITVFGFYPSDTNLVLREFEKCGVILKHITGPRDANWMHILYQSRYDARRALQKNNTQISSSLLIGVKPVDHGQKQILNESLNQNKLGQNGFVVSLPLKSPATRGKTNTANVSGTRLAGNVATPAKSVLSKALDLVFGV
ncbi:Nuclear pore complex protein NUP35 [Rhynchospora pubera]|uniref:Nuclear pore complex protein NUP35 n=1 Tax=Rhynchospora pubera TaxID=906938 RepID=A0AAV8FW06_9POAL|nr:Nuclear pore complex protein NUP35 [Rhynchospora pubera]